jgi:hypothetical protein
MGQRVLVQMTGMSYHSVDKLNLGNVRNLQIFPDAFGTVCSSPGRGSLWVHQAAGRADEGCLFAVAQSVPRPSYQHKWPNKRNLLNPLYVP